MIDSGTEMYEQFFSSAWYILLHLFLLFIGATLLIDAFDGKGMRLLNSQHS